MFIFRTARWRESLHLPLKRWKYLLTVAPTLDFAAILFCFETVPHHCSTSCQIEHVQCSRVVRIYGVLSNSHACAFLPLFRPCRVWLVKPNKGLSTPVVFRHLDYDQLSRVEPTDLLKQFVEEGLTEAEYVNDLELPAFKALPSLQKMKAELEVWYLVISEQIPDSSLFVMAMHCRLKGFEPTSPLTDISGFFQKIGATLLTVVTENGPVPHRL